MAKTYTEILTETTQFGTEYCNAKQRISDENYPFPSPQSFSVELYFAFNFLFNAVHECSRKEREVIERRFDSK